MITYCDNPVKLIRRAWRPPDHVTIQVWHTGQILIVPIASLEGEVKQAITRLDREADKMWAWYKDNG